MESAGSIRFVTAAGSVLLIAMGIGRFAYTPILPLMQQQAGLNHKMAGVIAAANLAGYLVGALLSLLPSARRRRLVLVFASVGIIVACTMLVAATTSPAAWLALRFATGLGSGSAFVLCSSILLDRAASEEKPWWGALYFAAVGIGIALTGLLVPLFASWGGWRAAWIGLGVGSLLLSVALLPYLDDPVKPSKGVSPSVERHPDRPLFPWLLVAYGGCGLSYIIPATFMVAMIARTPGGRDFAAVSWIVVGLVAAPSTLMWNRASSRIGLPAALILALLAQGIGFFVWIRIGGVFGDVVGAVALGATFMGVTSLGSTLGRSMYPNQANFAIGALTTSFGIGQIAGPLVATRVAAATGQYEFGVMLAAGVAFASALALLAGLGTVRYTARSKY